MKVDKKKKISLKEDVGVIEQKMLTYDQVECPVLHSFGPGVYIREVRMPKNTIAIGHKQNFDHVNILVKGCVVILNEDGTTSELKAPLTFIGKPGRKIGYIKEEMTWINVYSTKERDIDKLESYYLTKSDSFNDSLENKVNIKNLCLSRDKKDYLNVLDEFNFSHADVKKQVENKLDLIDLPSGSYKAKIGNSPIHGKGIFATSELLPGELIGLSSIEGKRTIFGRYTNHSMSPNSKMIKSGNNIGLFSTRIISGCYGGKDGEEITINYREALNLKSYNLKGLLCQQ